MREVSWKTTFKGKLIIGLNSGKTTEVFNHEKAQLCVFVMQALRILRNEFLAGQQVMEGWKIISFFPEERVLKIRKIKA